MKGADGKITERFKTMKRPNYFKNECYKESLVFAPGWFSTLLVY